MIVELISIGTETLMGNTVNSNTQFLAERCAMPGFDLFFQITVGDDYDRIMSVIRRELLCSDALILIGGLGPTEDDLAEEVCADAFGVPLEEDAHTREYLTESLRNNIYRYIPENSREMVTVPRGVVVLDNANGIAPGLVLEKDSKTVILLPGPPNELYPMSSGQVPPYPQQKQNVVLVSSMVKICRCGESQVEDMLLDLTDAQTSPTVATYVKTAEVHLGITARAGSQEEGLTLIAPVEKEIKDRFKEVVFTMGEQVSLEMAVADLLKQNNLTTCTVESCTGGMMTAGVANVPRVSDVFMEDVVTYSDEAKVCLLGVCENTLKARGAVSEETVREMVEGGMKASGIDLCVATTDIAGPDGDMDEGPASPVYMTCCLRGKTCVRRYQFKDSRERAREQAMMKSLDLVRLCILGES